MTPTAFQEASREVALVAKRFPRPVLARVAICVEAILAAVERKKAPQHIASPATTTPVILKARKRITAITRTALRKASANAVRVLTAGYTPATEAFREAGPPKKRDLTAAELAQIQAALDNLDQGVWDDMGEAVGGELEDVIAAQALAAAKALKIDSQNIFDLLNQDAVNFARARGAEMVGRKWVDGKLVDNPNARWAITDTTRGTLQNLLEKAYTTGWSPAELKKEILTSSAFSPSRAETIARTETAKASVQGSVAGWKRSGVVEGKYVLLSNDHDDDDECDDAADQGAIALDDDFDPGGDPPFHPRCNCSLVATLIPEDEEGEGEGAEESARNELGERWVTVNGSPVLINDDEEQSERVARAIRNQVPARAAEQKLADEAEAKLSKALGVPRTADNSAFDLRNDEVGIEVKTLVSNTNDKITMSKDALARKLGEAHDDELRTFTVVADMRGRQAAKYYVSERLGSLRIGSMTQVTLGELRTMVRGK